MRLPVIETCGECSRFHERDFGGAGECLHQRAPQNDNKANARVEPPDWCPLPKYTPPTPATSTA